MLLLLLLILAPFANTHNAPERIRVQHRVVHPSFPTTPWSELGTVALSPATFIPSDTLPDDLARLTESVDPTMEGAMYQLALGRPGVSDGEWPTSVTKACHLPASTSSHLTIHLSTAGLPFAVDHFVSPVPHDGACPPPDSRGLWSYPAHNTTVTLALPRQPPQPELRTPPALTPEGEPIAPAPEKSFLQKYWIYMAIVLAVLLVSGPADDQAGNNGGQGGR